jgi:DNA-binding response OmpR family regulator
LHPVFTSWYKQFMAGKILIVEDDSKIVRTLLLYLEGAGFSVTAVYSGEAALPAFRRERPDLVILDLNLPEIDGLEICRQLRQDSSVPIIMLTARVDEADRVIGLELGADDYILKPFSPREVVARCRAILRRTTGDLTIQETIGCGEISLNIDTHQAIAGGNKLTLTHSEFEILTALMRRPGKVFSREQLLEETQGLVYEGYERSIDQHIKNLRKKLRQALVEDLEVIETISGAGYRLIPPTGNG